jgi:hypothetical protein
MISREELRIRQLILDEYRSGSSIQRAFVNINVGSLVISKRKIEYWYKRFGSGNTCLFNKKSKQYGITGALRGVSNGKMVRSIKKININLWHI